MIGGMSQRALWSAGVLVFLVVAAACEGNYDEAVSNDAGASAPVDAAMLDATSTSETGTSQTDGSTSEGGTSDGGAACDPRKPFTKVQRVTGLPSGAFCTRLYEDERLAYYSFDKETRVATRGDDGGAFGVGTKVVAEGNPSCASLSADRTRFFYEDFFAVVQQSGPPGGPFTSKVTIKPPKDLIIGTPFFDEPRAQLYVTLHIEKGEVFGNTSIAVAPVTGGSVGDFRRVDVGFGVTGGDTPRDGGSIRDYVFSTPVPSPDGLSLYFTSTRAPDGGIADFDIWVATRTSLATDFGDPTRLEGPNGPNAESPNWISPDGCRLYFQSDREHPGAFSSPDAFLATREP